MIVVLYRYKFLGREREMRCDVDMKDMVGVRVGEVTMTDWATLSPNSPTHTIFSPSWPCLFMSSNYIINFSLSMGTIKFRTHLPTVRYISDFTNFVQTLRPTPPTKTKTFT